MWGEGEGVYARSGCRSQGAWEGAGGGGGAGGVVGGGGGDGRDST